MAGAAPIVDDLRAESDALDELVADLPAQRWTTATPAAGWTIAHQIAHLLWTDRVALTSVIDEAGFAAILETAAKNPTGFVDAGAEELAVTPPNALLADWRATRAALHDELLTVAEGRKLPWFGPPMSAASTCSTTACHAGNGTCHVAIPKNSAIGWKSQITGNSTVKWLNKTCLVQAHCSDALGILVGCSL